MLLLLLKRKKVTAPITLFLFLVFFSLNSTASAAEQSVKHLNQLIQEKLEFYNQAFPDIQFVHLKNGEWEKSLQALELFIGYQATNLDYEHPADLREELLYVTVEKIRLMLINKITSSYLFKAGQMPVAKKQYICVITIDPATTVLNNRVATGYLVDLPDEILASIPEQNYVNNEHHLDFILDHEAFHCLDTFNYGGIPMSDKDYSTRYDTFKRESQADMFAIAMNAYRHKAFTPCINNMKMMRGMTLLNGEPQHYSIDAIQLITKQDIKELTQSSPRQLFEKVKQLYQTIAPDYEQYMAYRVAAIHAIGQLGQEVYEMEKPFYPANAQPDEKLVKKLVTETRSFYQQFTGRAYTPGQ